MRGLLYPFEEPTLGTSPARRIPRMRHSGRLSFRGKKLPDISASRSPPPKPSRSGSRDFWEPSSRRRMWRRFCEPTSAPSSLLHSAPPPPRASSLRESTPRSSFDWATQKASPPAKPARAKPQRATHQIQKSKKQRKFGT